MNGADLRARDWLQKIRGLPAQAGQSVRIMNVCGGHERSITMAGLRGALPPDIELIPGPGCPVCVCPEEDIYAAIQLALRSGVMVAAFGDMLRVPCNGPKSQPRSLEQARNVFPNTPASSERPVCRCVSPQNTRPGKLRFAYGENVLPG